MKSKRKKLEPPSDEYLKKAAALSGKAAERLFARMRGKFTRRLEDKKYSPVEAIAMQLKFEDEQLEEWRKNVAKIRDKLADKLKDKAKDKPKDKVEDKVEDKVQDKRKP